MQVTKARTAATRDYGRIVLAIAIKDVVDSLKNRTTLTMILGLVLMMLAVEALPLLLKLDDRPRVAVYDGARSGVADVLRRDGDLQIREMRNAEEALTAARVSSGPLLAVLLPDDANGGTGALTAEGYSAHWLDRETVARLTAQAERELTLATGRPVRIELQSVYPTPESGGHPVMVAMGLVLVTTFIPTILVPHLIIEEKTAHTLEVLRVSPARASQVLLGKGIAGAVYGLLAAAVLLAFNLPMVNAWALMLAAMLALALFAVGLGLLIGTLVENEGAMQMWVVLLLIVLMLPPLLLLFGSSRLPVWAAQMMSWLPTAAAFHLMRLSFADEWVPEQMWPRLAAILVAALLVFIAARWRLYAWER